VERDTLLLIGQVFLFLFILYTLSYALQRWLASPSDQDWEQNWVETLWRNQDEYWKEEAKREFENWWNWKRQKEDWWR